MKNEKVKIGVLSDTHIPGKRKELPPQLMKALSGVDLIVHAGDINRDYVIYELEELAPVEAVSGNTDDDYMRQSLGVKKILTVGKHRIGVIHGDGDKGKTFDRVRKAFDEEKLSCIIFGHSHIPMNEVIGDVLYFNPGSPTDKRRQEKYSCGIITIDGDRIEGRMIYW